MDPLEIIMSPYEVYTAPVGTDFPDPEDAITADWKLLGKNGKYNQNEDGVVVSHEQTFSRHRTSGSVYPVKVARTEGTFTVGLTVEDLTLEAYAIALGGTVTDQPAGAGVAGVKSLEIGQGTEVQLFALLVRGASPYMAGKLLQYEVKRVFQAANPKPKFSKKDAAALELLFEGLEDITDPAHPCGKIRTQYADAT